MNYDRIVKEWFYRLPKGYAEAPYSDAELKVLDEVIQQFDVPHTPAEVLIEATADKADIKKIISDTDFTEEELEEIRSFIVSLGYRKTIVPYLESKGMTSDAYQIGPQAVKIIYNKIIQLPEVVDVIEYFKDPPQLSYQSTPFKGNIGKLSGLPKNVLSALMEIQPGADAGGNSTGPAEIAMALLFSNVTNRQGGGDLEIDGVSLEVKGKEARLGSQARGKKYLESSFVGYLMDKAASTGLIDDATYEEYINDSDHRNISIALRDAYEILTEAGMPEDDVVAAFQKGIASIFFENKTATANHINRTTDFSNVNTIMKQLVKVNIEAYMEKIRVDSILFHKYRRNSPSFDFVIIDKKDIDDAVESGTIRLGSKKLEGSFFWHDTNPGVVLTI